jgi:hypothetical protein
MTDEHAPVEAATAGPTAFAGERIPDRLAWSIVATILCCWPLGIPAIVYSAKTMSANSAGDFGEARRCSDKAKTWIIVCVSAWAVVMLLYLVFFLFFGGLAAMSAAGSTP